MKIVIGDDIGCIQGWPKAYAFGHLRSWWRVPGFGGRCRRDPNRRGTSCVQPEIIRNHPKSRLGHRRTRLMQCKRR